MDAYRSFDKNKFMYFFIKEQKVFDEYNEFWERVSNIIKKINSELIYNKKYLKAEERINTKEGF